MHAKHVQVLVLSGDLLVSALLGALLESEGFEPKYVGDGETNRDALVRLRPAVVLIDCEDAELCSDAFLGPAMMMGAKAIVFGGERSTVRLDDVRDRLGARPLVLPVRAGQLSEIIEDMLRE